MLNALISDHDLGQWLILPPLGHNDLDDVHSRLMTWWNLSHQGRGAVADHLAIYISRPDGSWRNALPDDPTAYRISWLEAGRSCARWDDVIFEFRTLRTVDGRSRSYPAATPDGHYLLIEPCDAYEWSGRALREVGQVICPPLAG